MKERVSMSKAAIAQVNAKAAAWIGEARERTHTSTSPSSQLTLLAAIAIGTMLAPLNSTMIAVALPDIQHAFDVSVTATALLVLLYLVAMAIGQPIAGRMGDVYGRRSLFLIGLCGFGVASLGCAFAPGLTWLIVFRFLQACAAALTLPNGVAMIREAMPPERRGVAFGFIGLAAASAAAAGPPIGGALVHAFGWSAIFWVNVPIIVITLLLSLRSLPDRPATSRVRHPFDLAGTALVTISLGALIAIPSILKLDQRWLAAPVGVVSVVAGVLFVRRELRIASPVIDVRLFQLPTFAAPCMSILLSNLVMYTSLLAVPLYLERVQDLGIQRAGLVLGAMSVFAAVCGPLGGRWSDRRGRRLPSLAGAVILLASTVLMIVALQGGSIVLIVLALALMGLGLGIAGAPMQTAAVEAVHESRTGSASGIYSTARYLGSIVGSSMLAVAFADNNAAGDADRFVLLFAVLAVAAIGMIIATSRIAGQEVALAS